MADEVLPRAVDKGPLVASSPAQRRLRKTAAVAGGRRNPIAKARKTGGAASNRYTLWRAM